MTGQVTSDPPAPKAGDTASFHLTASDPDAAPAVVRVADFGKGEQAFVCDPRPKIDPNYCTPQYGARTPPATQRGELDAVPPQHAAKRGKTDARPQGADGDDRAHPVGGLEGLDAEALVATPDVQLHTLAGGVPKRIESGPCDRRQAGVREPGTQLKTTVTVAGDEAVRFEGRGQTVRSGPRQPRGVDQIGQGQRTGLEGVEDGHGLVEDPNAAYTVHNTRLSSQNVR